MSVSQVVSVALISLAVGAGAGYWKGSYDGELKVTAQNSQGTVSSLTKIIDSHSQLVTEANAASSHIITLTAQRQEANTKSTALLKEVLHETSALRAECRFDDRVMQQLTDARLRATKAATSGLGSAVSATSRTD